MASADSGEAGWQEAPAGADGTEAERAVVDGVAVDGLADPADEQATTATTSRANDAGAPRRARTIPIRTPRSAVVVVAGEGVAVRVVRVDVDVGVVEVPKLVQEAVPRLFGDVVAAATRPMLRPCRRPTRW
jgi:hypothetical protein